MCLADGFLIVFGHQWRTLAQKTELNQALAAQTIRVSRMSSLLGLVFLAVRKMESPALSFNIALNPRNNLGSGRFVHTGKAAGAASCSSQSEQRSHGFICGMAASVRSCQAKQSSLSTSPLISQQTLAAACNIQAA